MTRGWAAKIDSMQIEPNYPPPSLTVNDLFFNPLHQVFPDLQNRHPCPEFPDEDWLRAGVLRSLEDVPSGRGFLQEHGSRLVNAPKVSNYFESLKSERRGRLGQEANLALAARVDGGCQDRLKDMPGMENYEAFALDGHWHRGAAHDGKHKGAKMPTGHFHSLNLRSHSMGHLAANDYHKEHDMHALKRIMPKGLRHDVPKGRRVLIVYDKAGIDFKFWKRCRKERAVYFLSRVKEDMVFEWLESALWDRKDPINAGVIDDRRVHTTKNIALRVVIYVEPVSGEKFEFLTNETDLAPGVIAELYRRRWEIEKTYDQLKNKLGAKQSWSSDQEAKKTQGQLAALTHNLLLLAERQLEERSGLRNEAEDERREKRRLEAARLARRAGRQTSSLLQCARDATVRSVKFIRWLRGCLKSGATAKAALPQIQLLYARL